MRYGSGFGLTSAVVSRAFQILSDADKKAKYDQFGGDPDSRFSGASAAPSSPFSGFARAPSGRGPMFESEMSPEDLFNQFFGGGAFSTFGEVLEDTFRIITNALAGGGGGPQFVFNMGGGNGFRVHQFGGATPRRRPRDATGQPETPPSGFTALTQLVPLLLLFILPLLSSLFSGASSTPAMRFDQAVSPHTMHRVTPKYKIDYFINPADVQDYTARKFTSLDQRAEVDYISHLRTNCDWETRRRDDEIRASQGFFFSDEERLKGAMEMEMPGCNKLEELRVRRQY